MDRKRGRPKKDANEDDQSDYETNEPQRIGRKKTMSEEARERHRVSNRLVAQRARAKAKAEAEFLRTEVVVLSTQFETLKNALRIVASDPVYAGVLKNCEEQRASLTVQASASSRDDDDEDDDEDTSQPPAPVVVYRPPPSRKDPPPPAPPAPAITIKRAPPPHITADSSIFTNFPDFSTFATNSARDREPMGQPPMADMLAAMLYLQLPHQPPPHPPQQSQHPDHQQHQHHHHHPHPHPSLQALHQMHLLQQRMTSFPSLYHSSYAPYVAFNLAAVAVAHAAQTAQAGPPPGPPGPLSESTLNAIGSALTSYATAASSSSASASSSSSTSTVCTSGKGASVPGTDREESSDYGEREEVNSENRSVEDDAEMVLHALSSMRSEILSNSSRKVA